MSKLIVITPEELEVIFDNRLRVVFREFLSERSTRHLDNVPGQAAPPYVSKREAARLLGVCIASVDNAARRGDLTRRYVGKAVRFDRQQVLALAKSHENSRAKRAG
jgi:hypothetical protein